MLERPPLPLRLPPLDGEPFDGWVEAYADRMKISIGDLLWSLGLSEVEYGVERLATKCTVMLRHDEAAEIERLTGTPTRRLRAMTLQIYNGHAVAVNQDRRAVIPGGPLWGRGAGSRYCPGCLRARGGRWLLRWQLS